MFKSAMLCVKPGQPGWKELLELARAALAQGSQLHVVSVVLVGKDEDEAERLAAARDELAVIETASRDAGFKADGTARVSVGTAGPVLTDVADELGVDLLIMGLGGRSRVGKALLGSDAQRVLLSTDRAVLSKRLG